MSTLRPMLYFHLNFVKLANLVSGFMTKCTFKGDFLIDADVPKEVQFPYSDEYKK